MVSKKTAFVVALVVGVAAMSCPGAGYAQPETPDWNGNVQLNDDTAVSQGLTNNYVHNDFNVALGGCLAPNSGTLTAPSSTRFSSPVLTFSEYTFEPFVSAPGNVSATAELKRGTKPGRYPLTMTCNGKQYSATFTIGSPAGAEQQQVRKVPDGAARTGGGGTASPALRAPRAAEQASAGQTVAGRAVTALSRSEPAAVDIPKIGAHSTLVPLGLNRDNTVEVPRLTQPMQAGWYSHGPIPGETGPAVILGHVDGNKEKGVFYRLMDLAPGDRVTVSGKDGSTRHFVVRRVDQVAKDMFPTDAVYGDTEGPELRLVTCGGSFDQVAQSYRDNVIVYATLE